MKQIIRGLRHRNLERQNYWMHQMLAAGPAAIPYLQIELRKECRLQSAITYTTLFSFFALLALQLFSWSYGYTRRLEFAYGAAFLLISLRPLGFLRPGGNATRLTEVLVGAAPGIHHPSTVCLLLDLWYLDASSPLMHALTTMLPALKASDSALLTPSHRETLHRILTNSTRTSLKLAVLKALEQVGDESAIPAVKRLAGMNVKNRWDAQLSATAEEVLPLLRARAESAKTSNVLLRSAEKPGDSILLRPAATTQANGEHTLLHPMSAE